MKKWLIIGLSALVLLILIAVIWYMIGISPVSNDKKDINFTVASGTSTKKIIDNLASAGLVRSKYAAYVYITLNKPVIQASTYTLNKAMNLKEIIAKLKKGNSKENTIRITFVEGERLDKYLDLIAQNFNWTKSDLIKKVNDQAFLKKLISKYDFLNDTILDSQLYYPLEGYLYPDTYEFYKTASFEDIIIKMLDHLDSVLKKYNVSEKEYSPHQILTMASIVEKEANSKKDRQKVAQVIYKRLNLKMNLGMDVTAAYGAKKDSALELTTADLNANNPYNTRRNDFLGLPIGPICNPSLESIEAVLYPASTDYIYFYADLATGIVHFTSDYNEFLTFKEIYG